MDVRTLAASFGVGLCVGILYGLIRVKSPAPPIVALLGLLGMVLGERISEWVLAKRASSPKAGVVHAVGERSSIG